MRLKMAKSRGSSSQYFSIEHAPARVTVQGHMMNDFKVEMDCVAWKEPR